MFLFFDTETTGLPLNWRAPITDTNNWPRLVQLAWILADEQGSVVKQQNRVVKPEGFTIPKQAAQIHGITTEQALEQGVKLSDALKEFLEAQAQARALVAHNISFDTCVVGAECVRSQQPLTWTQTPQVCTMKQATHYCQLPGKYGPRWPKLIELHEKLFGEPFADAHDALADVRACKKCFFALAQQGVLKTQKL
jgi:DNA polymerase III subunit epsilon